MITNTLTRSVSVAQIAEAFRPSDIPDRAKLVSVDAIETGNQRDPILDAVTIKWIWMTDDEEGR